MDFDEYDESLMESSLSLKTCEGPNISTMSDRSMKEINNTQLRFDWNKNKQNETLFQPLLSKQLDSSFKRYHTILDNKIEEQPLLRTYKTQVPQHQNNLGLRHSDIGKHLFN